jgi:hypothetical protein
MGCSAAGRHRSKRATCLLIPLPPDLCQKCRNHCNRSCGTLNKRQRGVGTEMRTAGRHRRALMDAWYCWEVRARLTHVQMGGHEPQPLHVLAEVPISVQY